MFSFSTIFFRLVTCLPLVITFSSLLCAHVPRNQNQYLPVTQPNYNMCSLAPLDHFGNTPLHQAALRRVTKLFDRFTSGDAALTTPNAAGMTPLHLAVSVGNLRVTEVLLLKRVDVNVVDKLGRSPLHLAVDRDDASITQLLVDAGADVNLQDGKGRTPLHITACKGAVNFGRQGKDCLSLILATDPDRDLTDSNGHSPIHAAAAAGNWRGLKKIAANDTNWKQQDEAGETPLHLAIQHGNTKVVEILLPYYRPEDQNALGETPFAKALIEQQIEVAVMLLNAGFFSETETRRGLYPLHLATNKGNEIILSMLAKLPRNGNHKNPFNGKTPLITAAENNNLEAVKILVQAGHEVNECDKHGQHALWYAFENIAIFRYLVENGSNVDLQNCEKNTPMHFAAQEDLALYALVLLQHGASHDILNDDDATAMDIARHKWYLGQSTIYDYIREDQQDDETSSAETEILDLLTQ